MPADEEAKSVDTSPGTLQFQPGELEAFDYSVEEFVDLPENVKKEVTTLTQKIAKRDTAARRMEVEQAWEARLFKRGYQYLLPRHGGGWNIPGYASPFGVGALKKMSGANLYETNIYGTGCDIITSALVRDIPECRFEPGNPNYDPDITAAAVADDFKDIFARNNDLRKLHTSAADYMCTDGRVCFYTRYVLDGQRFGYEDPSDDNPVAPEDEETGPPDSPNIEEGQQEAQDANDSPVPSGRKPRGREVTTAFGKLEHKCPINAQDQHEMDFQQLYWDVPTSKAKAKFPWIADKIQPGNQGVGEIELDRIARVNCALALEGSYVTGDSFNRDTTIQYNWLRPSLFMDVEDKEVRAFLFANFPDGMLVAFAGTVLAFARNESMDDHLHVLQSTPGSGQNRIALMSKVLSLQKRLNNWVDLLNDFFIRTVPQKWVDSQIMDMDAAPLQSNTPGGLIPFLPNPGLPVAERIFIEPSPTHQPELPEFIQLFFNDWFQMLSGALPSLFGAESNTDTASGISMQRDQALGRLASPWGALQEATACYFRQAVQIAAKCREKLGQTAISESVPGKGKVTLEVSDLKGNVLCFPETDSNFPETWVQRSSRLQQVFVEAQTNPALMKLLSVPENMKVVKDGIGLTELEIPEADAVDKQLGEFEILLKTAPLPNPKLVQAQQQFEESLQQATAAGEGAQFAQMAPQVLQKLQEIPPNVSSVQVIQDGSEDHDTEAATCKEWLNSPEGRKYKRGTPEERQAWENVHLHWNEHMQMAQQLKAPMPQKPPSVSIPVDKMPPDVAAQAVQQAGIQATPQDFMEQDAAETEQKITEKSADYGKGVPPKLGNSGNNSGAKVQ